MESRILLVENDSGFLNAIKANLTQDGHEVVVVKNSFEALKVFGSQRFNLAILQAELPEINGYTLCEKIRLEDMDTPILLLSPKDNANDKVRGLKAGADDCLTTPFHMEEFQLRVKVLVKHSLRGTNNEKELKKYRFGSNAVDFITYEAKGVEGTIGLTKKEAMLLKLLIDRKDQAVSREQILQYVWGYDVFPSTRTIDNFILSFRKYFEADPKNPQYFHSIRGIGYKFVDKASQN